MRKAIQLSKKGLTAPNPHVGCVIVREGIIVGEGYHDHAGGPHAEVVALTQAGELAKGADVYVTLEPCNHHGRTPPCSLALVSAGVRRVVIAVKDPNPRAAGGIRRLQEAGIATESGLLAEEAAWVNRQFLKSIDLGRPYVVAKAGMSLDGRIALPSGESQWITGPRARREGHRLRADCGVVMVGRRTVEKDNPQLTARLKNVVNQPLRVVLDPGAKLSSDYRVFGPEAETWHVTGKIDLPEILNNLKEQGRTGVLVEGGAATIGHFMREDLIDEVRLFVGPVALGSGPAWIGELDVESIAEAPRFTLANLRKIGPDGELTAVRIRQ
jgi:diaminohydroxyphosphoribosylaminopyrimidine deaminase/5-amino-6-(5-phosphoribosylamino)uracil reductase